MPTYRTNLGKTGFLSYENIQTPTNKKGYGHRPDGGLWMSRSDAINSWESWCTYNNPFWLSTESADVTIAEDARILKLDSDEKVQNFLDEYQAGDIIDYKRVMEKYDVIEFRYDDWKWTPNIFRTLDVDSVLCLNPSVITSIHNPKHYEPLVPGIISKCTYSSRPDDFIRKNLSDEEYTRLEQKRQRNSQNKSIETLRNEKAYDKKRRYDMVSELFNAARHFPSQATSIILSGIKEADMVLVVPPDVDPATKLPETLLCCKLNDKKQPVLEGALQINFVLWQAKFYDSEPAVIRMPEKAKPDITPLYKQAYIVDNNGIIQSRGVNITQINQTDLQEQYDKLIKKLDKAKISLKQNTPSWRDLSAHVTLTHQTDNLSVILQNADTPVFDSNQPVMELPDELSKTISDAVQKQYQIIIASNNSKIQSNKYRDLTAQNECELQCQYLSNIIKLSHMEANSINASIFPKVIAEGNKILDSSYTLETGPDAIRLLNEAQQDVVRYALDITYDLPFDSDKALKSYVYEAYGKLLQDAIDSLSRDVNERAIKHTNRYYGKLKKLDTILNNAPEGFDPADIMQKEGYSKIQEIPQNALFGKHEYSSDKVKNIVMGTIADSKSYQTVKQFIPNILQNPEITEQSCMELCQNITNHFACQRLRDELVSNLQEYWGINADIALNGARITIEPKRQFSDYKYKIECNLRDDLKYHLRLYHQIPNTQDWEFVSLPNKEAMDKFANGYNKTPGHDKVANVLKAVQYICQNGLDDFAREANISLPDRDTVR